jgi:hypothetical protein
VFKETRHQKMLISIICSKDMFDRREKMQRNLRKEEMRYRKRTQVKNDPDKQTKMYNS